jgi:hypothetical protein
MGFELIQFTAIDRQGGHSSIGVFANLKVRIMSMAFGNGLPF